MNVSQLYCATILCPYELDFNNKLILELIDQPVSAPIIGALTGELEVETLIKLLMFS